MTTENFPTRVLIGFTGHIEIENKDEIRSRISAAISQIHDQVDDDGEFAHVPAILTALAEGSDRLAADAISEQENGELHAVLPLQPDEYKTTFNSQDAKNELDQYLEEALTATVEPEREERPGVYLDVGKSIVDTCDVLLAVWDGGSSGGEGGTADIVEYARRHKTPLVWINPTQAGGDPILENFEDFSLSQADEILDFNDLKASEERLSEESEERLSDYSDTGHFDTEELEDANRVYEIFEKIFQSHFPVFWKANRYSLKNQNRYKYATILTYSLAAIAVGVISIQTLFFPDHPEFVLLESLAMIVIVGIVLLGSRREWHANWLKYRTLSEKVRSRWYIALSSRCTSSLVGPSPVHDRQFTSRWISDILIEAWKRTDCESKNTDIKVETTKAFLEKHWIENQIDYHETNSVSSQRMNRALSNSGLLVFLITLIASFLHATELAGHDYTSYILLISFFLPSVGGAFGAIRMSQDFETEALRSERILRQLEGLNYQLDYINDPDDLVDWGHEVEKILEIEHHNWRNIHEGKPLEPVS